MKEVKLPSGSVLKISTIPFADAKALYQALLAEAKGVGLTSSMEQAELFKNIFCVGFSSPLIEDKVHKCFERCLYDDFKITLDTFEPVKAREDYVTVCVEVAKEAIAPFTKNLLSEYARVLATISSVPA